jgi:hypothetical protein
MGLRKKWVGSDECPDWSVLDHLLTSPMHLACSPTARRSPWKAPNELIVTFVMVCVHETSTIIR